MTFAKSLAILFIYFSFSGLHHAWGQAEQTAKLIEGAKKKAKW